MKKCKYCGKKIDSILDFCCEQCENHYNEAVKKDSRNVKYFIGGILIGFLIMFGGVLAGNEGMTGAGILLIGVIVVIFPFVTPETIDLIGYRKARILGEIMAVLLIMVGIWIGFM